jgi:phage tail tube protein FII
MATAKMEAEMTMCGAVADLLEKTGVGVVGMQAATRSGSSDSSSSTTVSSSSTSIGSWNTDVTNSNGSVQQQYFSRLKKASGSTSVQRQQQQN